MRSCPLPTAPLALMLAALVGLAGARAGAEERLEIYAPRHRAAEDLAVPLSGILGPEGVAVPDPATGKLMIRGDRASLRQAMNALRELDVPLTAYRVESMVTTLRELRRNSIEIRGWMEAGPFRLARIPAPKAALQLRIRSTLAEGEERFRGVGSVLEGHPAEIWLGDSYPGPVESLAEELGDARVYETTTLVPVRTGFRVVPRPLRDGRISIEIAGVSGEEGPRGRVIRAGLATTLNVRPGELTVVAGLQRAGRAPSLDPFSVLDSGGRTHDTVLLLRVEPLPGEPP